MTVISTTKQNLIDLTIPKETVTYKPVSHKHVIERTEGLIKAAGFDIIEEHVASADGGKIMYGTYSIKETGAVSSEFTDMLSFQNSYNKRVALKYAYGLRKGNIELLAESVQFKRKHTGSVMGDFDTIMKLSLESLTTHRKDLEEEFNFLEIVKLNFREVRTIAADMYFAGILTTVQMTALRDQILKSIPTTLYELYDHLGSVLKLSHPAKQIEARMATHEYLKNNFGLI